MNRLQKKWIRKLKEAWNSTDRNYILWKTTNQIINDDTGATDELTRELAKWLKESRE